MASNSIPRVDLIKSALVDPSEIDLNVGQIPGVPPNPRQAEAEYAKLKQSMTKDSDFTGISEIALYPFEGRYVAIHGNLRARAAKELGWKAIPAKILPTDIPPRVIARFILLGNAAYGKWDYEKLADKWADTNLEDFCIVIPDEMETLDPSDLGEDFELPEGERSNERVITFTLSASQDDFINNVIAKAKDSGMTPDPRYGNADEDANIIHLIAKQWEERKK